MGLNFSFFTIILTGGFSLFLILQGTLLFLIACILYCVYFLIQKGKKIELEIEQMDYYKMILEKKDKELKDLRKQLNGFSDVPHSVKKKNQKLLLNLIKENNPLFLDKCKEMHPEFVEMLYSVNPALTQNDLKYCILIKYNFSSKEIGHILNVSANSVGVKRHRIREKLQITSKIRLNEWLNTA